MHRANGPYAARIRLDGVQRVARLLRGDLRRGHRVVAELFLGQLMLRVADLPIRNHPRRIELHLHLHVQRRHVQRPGQLRRKILRRILRRIEEPITPVAVARKDFQQIIVKILPADAEAIQRDALRPLRLHLFLERAGSTLPRFAAPSVSNTTRLMPLAR